MPKLLLRFESRGTAFWSNFADLFRRHHQPPLRLISWPAAPWPDIFVSTRWPWQSLANSLVLHVGFLAAVLWLVPLLPHREVVTERSTYKTSDLIYYSPSEYLPPLDTGRSRTSTPQKGEPAFAAQPILSVPPEADNRTQTIVTPPAIKLDHDVALPNIVAWSPTPAAVPMAATTHTDLRTPNLNAEVVAPSPDLAQTAQRAAPSLQPSVAAPAPEVSSGLARHALLAPEPSVVAPSPQMDVGASSRKVGEINIGHSNVVAPAPQLPVGEQRTLASMSGSTVSRGGGPRVAAPAPSVEGMGISRSGRGQIIALSVRPAPPSAAAPIPEGNRRGAFAAGPQGKPEAKGIPPLPGNTSVGTGTGELRGNGNGAGNGATIPGAPPGLVVGEAPGAPATSAVAGGNDTENKLTASITPPRLTTGRHSNAKAVLPENATPMERKIFGNRKFYSMMLNVANLNSSGGSWVLRFAELGDGKNQGELNGPVATQTSDPAYPMELMRKNVQGTVTLYAVIHADGTVGEVRVLDGVNDRLDEFAREALLRWKFKPATKDGNPVPLETVVRIPFKPFHFQSSF